MTNDYDLTTPFEWTFKNAARGLVPSASNCPFAKFLLMTELPQRYKTRTFARHPTVPHLRIYIVFELWKIFFLE
jgi:hypothetical protein